MEEDGVVAEGAEGKAVWQTEAVLSLNLTADSSRRRTGLEDAELQQEGCSGDWCEAGSGFCA